MHTSAWQLSLDVLMLISACFGFSTEDPMIQISAFRFPARSGSTPKGPRTVFFRLFFLLKNQDWNKMSFAHITADFDEISSDFQ